MKRFFIYPMVFIFLLMIEGCGNPNIKKMNTPKFVEIVVQNHMVSHGFDAENKEILEEVIVEKPTKKLIRVDRIQSVSEKYILTTYGFGRLVYWEYEGSYAALKELLLTDSDK